MNESLEAAKQFHASGENHWAGEALAEYKHQIAKIIKDRNVNTILDYGCGKAMFHQFFMKTIFKGKQIFCFDPAVPKYENKPGGRFDLVLCCDVMEHIQKDYIDYTLRDIFDCCDFAFISITCYPAMQTLPNGKNAHYTVRDPEWWDQKLEPYQGKYQVIYQTQRERSKVTRNPDPVGPDPNAQTDK